MTFPQHGRRAAPAAPARPRQTRRSAITRQALPMLAMGFVGAMLVATSVPALAVTATDSTARASVYAPVEDTVTFTPQHVEVGADAVEAELAAESYDVVQAPPPIVSQVAGLGSVSIIESDRIVWPVQSPDRRSDGFGPRDAPCAGCSTAHDGVDFTPGEGTPVMSIADGVVVKATENGGGLGVNVEVEHNIGGELITSSYAHMQFGSIAVSVGQRVTAGQQVGNVGNTGQSTGPHMHLEMFGADGVRFDGFAWLGARIG
ncbi:M23 family metallopeptidase [Agromyces endophyticus]|uniref:M23 family metallopeptidase n=1 Tax=Agromyces sp. H17E-10 TaxID=2932244 RepID=UPI001FD45352|nr:M23 family metallopeptidase [Agromyces sp. H17E-10]UOQ88634.1 M23 family metallopeptidase [Agromyces sp. H17E-10]